MTNKNKECAGTYQVSGYTRSDGTKVDSYTRTCGAKHEGNVAGGAAGVNENGENDIERLLNNFLYSVSLAPLQKIWEVEHDYENLYHIYYKLSLDYDNQKYWNNDNYYDKFKDMPVCSTKDFIKNMDIPGLNDYTDVVHPQMNSPLYKSVHNSVELKKELKLRYKDIKNDKYKDKGFSIYFGETKDLRLTLGHATLYNVRIVGDKIYGTLIDYYDFQKMPWKEAYSFKNFRTTFVNNNAYKQQKVYELTNYLIVMPICVPTSSL